MNIARRVIVAALLALPGGFASGEASPAPADAAIDGDVRPAPGSIQPAGFPVMIYIRYRAASTVSPVPIVVRLDARNVTSDCRIGGNTVWCTPQQVLAQGRHVLDVEIGGLRKRWSFDAVPPPALAAFEPASGAVLPAGAWPTIQGRIVDPASGLLPATFSLTVDDVDVTAQAQFAAEGRSAGSFRYRPLRPPATGDHRVTVRISSRNGLGMADTASFVVDIEATYAVNVVTPADGAVVAASDCEVVVATASNKSLPEAVMIAGRPAALRSIEPKPWTWSATVPLTSGTNTIPVEVTFENGTVRSTRFEVTYAAVMGNDEEGK